MDVSPLSQACRLPPDAGHKVCLALNVWVLPKVTDWLVDYRGDVTTRIPGEPTHLLDEVEQGFITGGTLK